jgi:hypothetical protein
VELSDDVLQVVIPNLKLEMAPSGQVTVYNCLFYDEA